MKNLILLFHIKFAPLYQEGFLTLNLLYFIS